MSLSQSMRRTAGVRSRFSLCLGVLFQRGWVVAVVVTVCTCSTPQSAPGGAPRAGSSVRAQDGGASSKSQAKCRAIADCEIRCSQDSMHLELTHAWEQKCKAECRNRHAPLQPACAECGTVPRRAGAVFLYGESALTPIARFGVETELLSGFDVDGTGTRVYRVPLLPHLTAQRSATDLRWELYVVRGSCARSIGTYTNMGIPRPTKRITNGFVSFELYRWNEKSQAREVKTYSYDGTAYRDGPWRPL